MNTESTSSLQHPEDPAACVRAKSFGTAGSRTRPGLRAQSVRALPCGAGERPAVTQRIPPAREGGTPKPPRSVARSAHSLHWTAWHACALRTAAAAHRGSKRAQTDTAVTAAVRVHHVSPRAKATAVTAVTDYYYPQEAIRCMAWLVERQPSLIWWVRRWRCFESRQRRHRSGSAARTRRSSTCNAGSLHRSRHAPFQAPLHNPMA
jgi:hypothetical protein